MKYNQRRAAQSVLVFGILMGIVTLIYQFFILQVGVGNDFQVYYHAAIAFLSGNQVYGIGLGPVGMPYLYSPPTILFFVPLTVFQDWSVAFGIFSAIQIGAGVLLSTAIISFLKRRNIRLDPVEVVLVVAFVLASSISIGGIRNGNINVILAYLVTIGTVSIHEEEHLRAGISLAIAAHFKIFVAFYALWFVIKRSWRAIAWTLLFSFSGVVVSFIIGIDTTIQYLTYILGYSDLQIPAGGIPPEQRGVSLLRPLSQIFPFSQSILTGVSVGILLLVIGYVLRRVDSPVGEIYLLFWVLVTPTIVFFPEYLELVLFPIVALLFLVEDPREHLLVSAGAVLLLMKIGFSQYETVISLLGDGGYTSILLQLGDVIFSVASLPLYGVGIVLIATIYNVQSEKSSSQSRQQHD
jgi:hypothetical protein